MLITCSPAVGLGAGVRPADKLPLGICRKFKRFQPIKPIKKPAGSKNSQPVCGLIAKENLTMTKLYKNPLHKITKSDKETAEFLYNQDFKANGQNGTFPLATYRDFVGHSANLNRVLLAKMRRVAASIMTTEEKHKFDETERQKKYLPPLEFCGVNMGFLAKGLNPTVDVVRSLEDKVHLKNLAACAMIWRCPVCSLKIMKGRAKSIYALAKSHERAKLKTGFVTLTIPHKRSDSLAEVLELLTGEYKKFQATRFFKEFAAGCKRKGLETPAGMLGQVKSVEITWKYRNGWHPHLHILYFYSENVNDVQIRQFQENLIKAWALRVGESCRPMTNKSATA